MRPGDKQLAKTIEVKLISFSKKKKSLRGLRSKAALACLVEQIVDSVRRIKYILLISGQDVSDINIDVTSNLFDPLKGAVWYKRRNEIDEAFWLVFLSTHFGKHLNTGWRLTRDVYGGLTDDIFWNWERIVPNTGEFREWLEINKTVLKQTGKFGNHRKYESISGIKPRGTGAAVQSYVEWVSSYGGHEALISEFKSQFGDDPKVLFKQLYNALGEVVSFGRTAKFDFLTMIGKLGLADVEPNSTYVIDATGPKTGARLLFGNDKNFKIKPNELEEWLADLESHLGLYFGMQVLEDALCNWQKNPRNFIHFSG